MWLKDKVLFQMFLKIQGPFLERMININKDFIEEGVKISLPFRQLGEVGKQEIPICVVAIDGVGSEGLKGFCSLAVFSSLEEGVGAGDGVVGGGHLLLAPGEGEFFGRFINIFGEGQVGSLLYFSL